MAEPESLTTTRDFDPNNKPPHPVAKVDAGYDQHIGELQNNKKGQNAWLVDSNDNTHVTLWVSEITTDLSLAGSTAQSALKRDFYPKNFQQPTFTVTCQAPGQREYGRVVEFIHKSMRNSIQYGSLMGFTLPQDGLRHTASGMKGVRKGLSIAGYVGGVQRAHKQFEVAPTFSFEFVVARQRAGVFKDEAYKYYELAKWSDIFKVLVEDNTLKPPQTYEQAEQQEAEALRDVVVTQVSDFFGNLFDGG